MRKSVPAFTQAMPIRFRDIDALDHVNHAVTLTYAETIRCDWFAQHGWAVTLVDTAPAALQKASATIRTNLERQVKKGTLPPDAPDQVLSRISNDTDLGAVAQAELVIEAASESPAIQNNKAPIIE